MHELDKFIRQEPSGHLYHYTGAEGVIGILKNRCLWATDFRHLNDRQEYRIGAKLLVKELDRSELNGTERTRFTWLVRRTQQGCYVLSFSEHGDQLSQWRAYCPGSVGYSLGFGRSNKLFNAAKNNSFNLIRCVYEPEEQEMLCRYLVETFRKGFLIEEDRVEDNTSQNIRNFFNRYQWNLALSLVMSALKHRGFREEQEWRLVSQYPEDALHGVSFRPGRFGVIPYFELPMTVDEHPISFDELIIGPTPNRSASRTALELLLLRHKSTADCVRVSSTPLRR